MLQYELHSEQLCCPSVTNCNCALAISVAVHVRIFAGAMHDTPEVQLQARLCAVKCMFMHNAVLPHVPAAAVAMFEEQWSSRFTPGEPGHIRDVSRFMRYNMTKLQTSFTLRNIWGGGHEPKLPDEQARKCAAILAEGYMQTRYIYQPPNYVEYQEHAYFTSIRDAVQRTKVLQDMLDEYEISTDHLLRRCHEVDRHLQWRHLPMKRALPDETLHARVAFGNGMQFRLLTAPQLLLDVFCMDECTIWVGKDLMGKLRVWCHSGEFEGKPPTPNEWLGRGKPFKISILLVVSARYGCVYFELLTGTKDLKKLGRYNVEWIAIMQQRQDKPYKVRRVT
jgi:hypothetical protein